MKTDIYQTITQQIIEALEKVSVEDYQAPFARLSAQKAPINPTTGKHYRGINTLILWLMQSESQHDSNEWATFKQWKDKGAQVKKGEKSSQVIFYKKVEKQDAESSEENNGFYHLLKSFNVFNAAQVEGYTPKPALQAGTVGEVQRIDTIESYVEKTGAVIEPNSLAACYVPSLDKIEMPSKDRFYETTQTATDNYYAVLLHELTHWTGGKSRLDREQKGRSHAKEYAQEELIAELGSAFLCSQWGIMQQGRDDHAIYIKSWLKALKNDTKYVFQAAAHAQKALDYLNEKAGFTP